MKNKFIICILMLLAFAIKVDAISLKPTGDTTGVLGSTLKVYITLERSASEETISAVDGLISWDSDVLTLSKQTVLLTDWTKLSEVSNGGKFAYGNLTLDNLITETSTNIVELTFTVNSTASIGNTNISISSANGVDSNNKDVSLTGQTHTINVLPNLSSDNKLTSLKVNGTAVSGFVSTTTTYDLTVAYSVSSVVISSTLSDSKASYVEGYGNRTENLDVGSNTLLVQVKAEDGNVRTYTLNITRQVSTINTLKSLSLSSGTISNFNSNTTTYNVSVANNVSSVTISSTLTDSTSSYVEGYGNRKVDLDVGNNPVLVKVKAANGDIKTYTINITRAASSVNTLKTLSLSSGTISNFNSNTTSYSVSVPNDVSSVTITSTLTDSTSSYVEGYGNRKVDLDVGSNTVLIKVKAASGDIKTYTLTITRAASSVNTLKTLSLSSGTINNFSSSTRSYNVSVPNDVSSVTITSTLTDTASSYVDGYGNRKVDLDVGSNQVLIKVKAEDGTIGIYTLNITRAASSVNTLKSLSLSSGTISNFNSNTTTYNVSVANNVSSVTISSTLTDSTSTYVDGYGNRKVSLTVGSNAVLVKVKSASGEINTYTINITRAASSVNTLKSLSLSSGAINNFNSNTTTYNVSVPNNVSSVTITSTLTDSTSTYVDGYGNREVSLTVGSNVVLVKVKSASGEINTYTLNITRAKSSVNTLKSLSLSSGDIEFSSNITNYNVTVSNIVSEITLTSVLTDNTATYESGFEGNRTVSLTVGSNTVKIIVVAQDGTKRTYTLNITRADAIKSSVNSLKSLTLTEGEFEFNPDITEYVVIVHNSVDKVGITSELLDSKSEYVEGYGNREEQLEVGPNEILIKVQAEDGSIKVYTLNITREPKGKSTINTLSSLTLSYGVIEFDSNIDNYSIVVENSVSSIEINSQLTDVLSSYVEGYGNREEQLAVGTNEILIKVQAENGDIKTYTINVVRESKNNDNLVANIEIDGYDINFDNNIKEYDLKIKDEKKLNFNILLFSDEYTYEIFNNEDLSDGKVITVKVTGDNKIEEYLFNITVSGTQIDVPKTSSNTPSIIVIGGIIFAILGLGIVYFIKKRKRHNQF